MCLLIFLNGSCFNVRGCNRKSGRIERESSDEATKLNMNCDCCRLIYIILDHASVRQKFGVPRWRIYISKSYIPDLLV